MVDITEEEFKEYMYLKRKEAEREEAIQTLKQLTPRDLPHLRRKNTIHLLATTFVKVVKKLMKEEEDYIYKTTGMKIKVTSISKSWFDMKKYLTPLALQKTEKGKWEIKKNFREILRQYGIKLKLDRKHGALEIIKILPKRV